MPPWRVYLLFPDANSLPNRRLLPPEFPSPQCYQWSHGSKHQESSLWWLFLASHTSPMA